jgi:hypothetical protein
VINTFIYKIQLIECRSLPTWHFYIRIPSEIKAKCRKRSLQLPWVMKKDSAGDYSVTGTPACICVGLGNVSYFAMLWATGDYCVTGTPDSISLGKFPTLPRRWGEHIIGCRVQGVFRLASLYRYILCLIVCVLRDKYL